MTIREERGYAMLVRVRDFGQVHRDRFPESSIGARKFADVAVAVATLSEKAARSHSSAHAGEAARAGARQALVERLTAIARTAWAIDEETPGASARFRLPPHRQQTDISLLTAGRVFVESAKPIKERFIGHAMPPTFIAELQDLMDRFEQAMRECDAGRTGRHVARAGITTTLAAGTAAARTLDVIVANEFRDDGLALAMWADARRLGYRHRPPRTRLALPAAPLGAALLPARVVSATALPAFPERLGLPAPRGVLAPATADFEKPEQV